MYPDSGPSTGGTSVTIEGKDFRVQWQAFQTQFKYILEKYC